MLRSLHIENIAVIRRADLDFGNGFSVLTGETGAGKSMIIDSINLLLGNRVPKEIIRSGEESATVGAVFDTLSEPTRAALYEMGFTDEDGTFLLQKTIHRDGKAQTRLNGQAITQSMQKEIARMLVSIHGQSDNQKLLQKSAHLELLDAYARPDAELEAYRALYREWKDLCRRLDGMVTDDAEKLRRTEMLRFQIADIDAMKLKEGEEETLVKERDRLANLEKINKQVHLVYRALRGSEKGASYDLLVRSASALRSIDGLVDGASLLADRLDAAASEIEDVAESVLAFADDDREDPTARIDRIESRLDGISKLQRKYGATVADILAYRAKAAAELDSLELSGERAEELRKKADAVKKNALAKAAELHLKRVAAAKEITALVTESLVFLDMPKVRFDVRLTPVELHENGIDDAEFLIAANPGEPLLPMIRIASGGELSRIMLALRSVLNDRDGASTVIFDEVDTGVSGKTSRKIGVKLRETAKNAQVLCVTHSAQIASLAESHYRITKTERAGRAETDVVLLDGEERVEEIARILGGIEITDLQRDAAREMLAGKDISF